MCVCVHVQVEMSSDAQMHSDEMLNASCLNGVGNADLTNIGDNTTDDKISTVKPSNQPHSDEADSAKTPDTSCNTVHLNNNKSNNNNQHVTSTSDKTDISDVAVSNANATDIADTTCTDGDVVLNNGAVNDIKSLSNHNITATVNSVGFIFIVSAIHFLTIFLLIGAFRLLFEK